jgi:hypothetical protein
VAFQLFLGREDDWSDAPHALGMQVGDRGLLFGQWNRHVEIRGLHDWREVHHHNETHRQHFTQLYAFLDPPLLMGLEAHERGAVGRLVGGLFGQHDIQIGQADFDQRFAVKGLDPEHVRRLLSGPPGAELLRAAGHFPSLTISDDRVVIEHNGYERDLDKVRASLEAVGRIGEALMAQRAREPAAWEGPLRAAWGAVAQGWQLSFDAPRATIEGVARGLRLRVRPHLFEGHLITDLEFSLPSPPACSIALSPQHGGDGFFRRLFRGQDINLGDAAFDAAFVIKGEPEAEVRALLTPAARQRLMEARSMAEALELEKGTLKLRVPKLVLAPDHLDDLLKHGFAAAAALSPHRS